MSAFLAAGAQCGVAFAVANNPKALDAGAGVAGDGRRLAEGRNASARASPNTCRSRRAIAAGDTPRPATSSRVGPVRPTRSIRESRSLQRGTAEQFVPSTPGSWNAGREARGKERDAMKALMWSCRLLLCVYLGMAVESGAQTPCRGAGDQRAPG